LEIGTPATNDLHDLQATSPVVSLANTETHTAHGCYGCEGNQQLQKWINPSIEKNNNNRSSRDFMSTFDLHRFTLSDEEKKL
jgi:hypothetical protein